MLAEEFSRLPLRAVLFADGVLAHPEGKTAQGVLRHSTVLETVAVVDRSHGARTTAGAVPGTDVPVVSSVEQALAYAPDAFVVAMTESDHGETADGAFRHVPLPSGDLPAFWWDQLRAAAGAGLHILSCLHLQLAGTELREQMADGRRIVDIRRPHPHLPKYSGRSGRTRASVVHVAGSDCVVGKRTAALEIQRAARARGVNTGYVGTGQTCQLVGCTTGAIIDRAPVFQAAGLVEHLVLAADPHHDLLITKGQASVLHPAFGGLATSILQGSRPDAVVFVHDPRRRTRYHWEHLPVAAPEREIPLLEELGGAPVVAVVTRGRENVRALGGLGLPVVDVLDGGADTVIDAVDAALAERSMFTGPADRTAPHAGPHAGPHL
ncbi:DUF1611 domain-containing protein [Streptomyces sp. SID10853]|uniref:DUF1611 domain-containing protein n=1 Tax=Streptomyces sp. SID10853 TaxID=2706028 RepID=UPI0013C137C5|nr:DUF1611 domain-containing protein [Streptomyces sp. SID10853]NDZ80661.1 DUF1611 domain-containing protein [Streptomyces sp. SID10853]